MAGLEKLKDFVITENSSLELIERFLQRNNYMEVFGIAHHELSHSNFLAWLLQPTASHNLGSYFLKKLVTGNHKLLANAQEGKTKAMRQMRFSSIDDVDEAIVEDYVNEAIKNQKQGKEVTIERTKKEVKIPNELSDQFQNNTLLKSKFLELSNYKQREYCDYITSAKREATKQTRLDKITPMLLEGVGLNDKYKNC